MHIFKIKGVLGEIHLICNRTWQNKPKFCMLSAYKGFKKQENGSIIEN